VTTLKWSAADRLPDCDTCRNHLLSQDWTLTSAAASVGIEHGKSAGDMIRIWIHGYHERGHRPQ
jgi:hypothetical protein